MTIMIGIDPHKATHTAVAIDHDENVIDQLEIRASKTQARRLCEWAGQFDDKAWAVESARGLGYLVAQQLVAAGETVFAARLVRPARLSQEICAVPVYGITCLLVGDRIDNLFAD